MHLWVDADACPVTDVAIQTAGSLHISVTLVCDDAHRMERAGAETIIVSKGADSADFALVNRIHPGDVVVTQDYGLAAMCLARGAVALHQDGYVYDEHNIDSLLAMRHLSRKARMAGQRTKGPAKRKPEQDERFRQTLTAVLRQTAAER
ncbi:MAG: YaiI/YqxD family protein [Eubacteriales bacterium]|nr:YaiI/YqxD family protein [Eubacteriales bacterium]